MPGLEVLSREEMAKPGSDSPKKSKQVKASVSIPAVASPSAEKEGKKRKKEKKAEMQDNTIAASEKKMSKRKHMSPSVDDGPPVKKVKAGEIELDDQEGSAVENGSVQEEAESNPMAVSNFPISEPLRSKLKSRKIEALFPIQAQTFNIVMEGEDLVGRARTGQVSCVLAF